MNDMLLNNWPKTACGSYICTKDKPMPMEFKKEGRWRHDDVHETDYDSDYSIEWKCHSCGHIWRTEMPD